VKVVVSTEDLLLRHFLVGLLREAEGLRVEESSGLGQPPDGDPGWVVVVAEGDWPNEELKELLDRDWVSGLLVCLTEGAPESISVPGVVTVGLPCTLSELVESLAGAEAAVQPTGVSFSAQPVLLVAEDSPLQRQVVVSTLKAEGFTVLEAPDGRAAFERLQAEAQVDLVLTDVEMPHMTGLELTRAIREDPRFTALPVLVLTTLSGYEQVKEGFDAGASDYLVKPRKGERELFLEELITRVHALLQKSRPVMGRRALVVDDSPMTRRLVATTMEQAGFRVALAEDGMQAKGLLENPSFEVPDIMVTDLEMPGMDGLRLTHFAKNEPRTRDLPVVILTASTHHRHRVLGRGFGVDAYITKPFSQEKLVVTVDQVLSRTKLEKEKRELAKILGRDVMRAIHREGLEPRKRELTILFSDLAGFSRMCFGMEAAQVVELLNDYFDRFVDFVLREQGYVNKFIGDALVALFSTLPGLDPPQVRATRAGVEFQREMLRVNQDEEVPLLTRIGINTGDVIMGLIGGGERKDYTVIGDQVNRSQRLEGKAPVGGLLLSEGTHEIADSYLRLQKDLQVVKVDNLELKGIAKPISAFSVTMAE